MVHLRWRNLLIAAVSVVCRRWEHRKPVRCASCLAAAVRSLSGGGGDHHVPTAGLARRGSIPLLAPAIDPLLRNGRARCNKPSNLAPWGQGQVMPGPAGCPL